MAAREQIAGQFAQRHRDQLDTLLLDARRLFRRWGPGAMATLERWRAQAGAGGYAGAAEQEAARRALEAAKNMKLRNAGIALICRALTCSQGSVQRVQHFHEERGA